jgi:hypothetical protein
MQLWMGVSWHVLNISKTIMANLAIGYATTKLKLTEPLIT